MVCLFLPRMLAPLARGSSVHRYAGGGAWGGGSAAVPYLMGLNMAFPKSWNLRTSFRCTPLGFTTWGGNGTLAAWKASPARREAPVVRSGVIQLSTPVSASHSSFQLRPSASAVIFSSLLLPGAIEEIFLWHFSQQPCYVLCGTFSSPPPSRNQWHTGVLAPTSQPLLGWRALIGGRRAWHCLALHFPCCI